MSDKIKNLKSYFNKGDVPTEAQFHELIDSFMLKSNDKLVTSAKLETNGDAVFTFSDNTTLTIPKYKLPDSKPVSFITGLQAALDAKAAKNGDATQIFKVKDATANDDAVSKQQLDAGLATKAAKNGDATQSFKVKDATANDDAVSKQQLDAGLATKAAKNGDATQIFKVKDATANDDAVSKQQLDAGLATKAAKNGDATQIFKVKDATTNDDAVSKQQLDAGLATKAAKNGDNTQIFKVKDATANDDAVSKEQMDAGLATKAAKNGDNTQTFKVKNAVNADEAISKQQFDAVFNRLIPAPFIDKLSTTENKIYQQPSTKTVVNIFGSYFTPTSTVTATGLTVSDFKFISDNQLQVSITATASTGNYDVIVNNGSSTTKAKAWIVSSGEVTVPQPSDFTIVSGQADISKAGEIRAKQIGINGLVKFFNIPSSENFQLEFKASKSPLYTFPLSTMSDKMNSMKLYIGGVEKLWFYYVLHTSGLTVLEIRHNNGAPAGWTGSTTFEHLNLIKLEKKDGKLNLYVNNTIKASFDDTTTGNVELRAQVKELDYIEIKKYKL